MKLENEIAYDRFNRLPSLEAACLEREKNADALQEIGEFLCRENLEHLLGVTIGHKHYDLQPNEYILRILSESSYLTFVSNIKRNDLLPISWTLNDRTGLPEVSEWIIASDAPDDRLPQNAVQRVFAFINSLKCGDAFGLSRLSAYPSLDGVSYEKTCNANRIQLVSATMEDEVSSASYAQSQFRFASTPTGIAIYAQQKCQLCRGCFNSEKSNFTGHVASGLSLATEMSGSESDEITSMRKLHANLMKMERAC